MQDPAPVPPQNSIGHCSSNIWPAVTWDSVLVLLRLQITAWGTQKALTLSAGAESACVADLARKSRQLC
eukprot:3163182-Rhodomonas_salina.1